MSTGRSNKHRNIGAWLGILGGLYGIVVTLIWIANQAHMASGTPLSILILGFYGRGLVFLASHLALFIAALLSGVRAMLAKPLDTPWLRLLVAFSLVYTCLSLLPFSTVGFSMLPGAAGSLVSNLLLLRSK